MLPRASEAPGSGKASSRDCRGKTSAGFAEETKAEKQNQRGGWAESRCQPQAAGTRLSPGCPCGEKKPSQEGKAPGKEHPASGPHNTEGLGREQCHGYTLVRALCVLPCAVPAGCDCWSRGLDACLPAARPAPSAQHQKRKDWALLSLLLAPDSLPYITQHGLSTGFFYFTPLSSTFLPVAFSLLSLRGISSCALLSRWAASP